MAAHESRSYLVKGIRRLQKLDHLLRTEGVHVRMVAKELKITVRQVMRHLVALRELVGPTEAKKLPRPAGAPKGVYYRQKYVKGVRRFFAK